MNKVNFPTVDELVEIAHNEGVDHVHNILKNLLPAYPKMPQVPRLNTPSPTPEEIRKHADNVEAYNAKSDDFLKEKEGYKKIENEKEQLMEEVVKQYNNFYDTVPQEYQAKVWYQAWADGHSYGWTEVSSKLSSLVDIFS